MIRINELFLTESAAFRWMADMVRTYRPAQFGTRLVKRRSRCGRYWQVDGSRFDIPSAA